MIALNLDGTIGPATEDHVAKWLRTAAAGKAPLVVTPRSCHPLRAIIQSILAAPIPVVSYVSPSRARVTSAGTFVLHAGHFAAMARNTNTGTANPVQIGGVTPAPDKDEQGLAAHSVEAKAVNDAVGCIVL